VVHSLTISPFDKPTSRFLPLAKSNPGRVINADIAAAGSNP
jgi:hypothetical protein